MHVGMRDGLGNVIPVQVFHIALFDIKGEPRHLVGLRTLAPERWKVIFSNTFWYEDGGILI